MNFLINNQSKGFYLVSTALVILTGLASYWFGTNFPLTMTWFFIAGTAFTYTAIYWMFKHGNTSLGWKAAQYMNLLLNGQPWSLNVTNYLAMMVGYAFAGLWLVVVLAVIYIAVLSWVRKRAIAEYEKLNGFSA